MLQIPPGAHHRFGNRRLQIPPVPHRSGPRPSGFWGLLFHNREDSSKPHENPTVWGRSVSSPSRGTGRIGFKSHRLRSDLLPESRRNRGPQLVKKRVCPHLAHIERENTAPEAHKTGRQTCVLSPEKVPRARQIDRSSHPRDSRSRGRMLSGIRPVAVVVRA
jgi:hypothetical protein